MKVRTLIILISCIFLSAELYSQSKLESLFQTVNLDFEDGVTGQVPVGWEVPFYAQKLDYKASLTDLQPVNGRYCLELSRDSEYKENIYGAVSQSIDATPYKGKKIRFRAAVRAEITGPKGSAHLWLHEHLVHGQQGFFERMEDEPIVINNWEYYEIVATIDEYADVINFGLLLMGNGRAWIDDASFEVISDIDTDAQPPSPITETGVKNLEAFSKLFGYIRYFHPSYEAQNTDWTALAYDGVKTLEGYSDQKEFAAALDTFFEPVAPSLEIFTEKKIRVHRGKPASALPDISIAWIQNPLGLEMKNQPVSSRVVNVFHSRRDMEGTVIQTIPADGLHGTKLKYSAKIKCEPTGIDGNAQLWIRIDGAKEKILNLVTMADNPAKSKKWKRYSIEAEIPEDAREIRLGLVLIGDGKAWFDGLKLKAVSADGAVSDVQLRNPGFENGNPGELVRGWIMPKSVKNAGYSMSNAKKGAAEGKQCMIIESDLRTRIEMPKPGQTFSGSLPRDLSFSFPIALWVDSIRSLPYPTKENPWVLEKSGEIALTANDRASRLATVIIAWNYFKQFHLFDVDELYLNTAFRYAIKKAATDKNEEEFLLTLQELTTVLNDGQARVWHGSKQLRHGLPVIWKWIDGKLVIIKVMDGTEGVEAGDVVTSIDGVKTKDALSNMEIYVSGATDHWKKVRALAMIRAGEAGSKAELEIIKNDRSKKKVVLERNTQLSELTESRPDKIAEPENGIVYIDLTRVGDKDLMKILPELKSAEKIIFDLRGISKVSQFFLGAFIDRGLKSVEWRMPVYSMPDQKLVSHNIIYSSMEPLPVQLHADLLFLCDERTIGYAEAILHTVQEYRLGGIVGRETAGTCGEIIPLRLPCGYNLSVTAVAGYGTDGKILYGKGIVPATKVAPYKKGTKPRYSPILDKAIEMMR